ncbi:IS66 family transposase [Bradyrhizobium liaoningense]|uniref:IS66 family transposase n=1 Tax=Bradyrhizobium liaoningense TaxID=43992 RepID=UPI001BA6E5A1|nr:transposase [Bradyrhizobium liaoningense]
MRQERSRPLVIDYRRSCANSAPSSPRATIQRRQPITVSALGRICTLPGGGRLRMSDDAAERALQAAVVGRRNWTFAGSNDGSRLRL